MKRILPHLLAKLLITFLLAFNTFSSKAQESIKPTYEVIVALPDTSIISHWKSFPRIPIFYDERINAIFSAYEVSSWIVAFPWSNYAYMKTRYRVTCNDTAFAEVLKSTYSHYFDTWIEPGAVPPEINIINYTFDNQLDVYPNPVDNILYYSSHQAVTHYDVVNSSGLIIQRNKLNIHQHSIPTTSLSAGVYYIRFYNEFNQHSLRSFIKR